MSEIEEWTPSQLNQEVSQWLGEDRDYCGDKEAAWVLFEHIPNPRRKPSHDDILEEIIFLLKADNPKRKLAILGAKLSKRGVSPA